MNISKDAIARYSSMSCEDVAERLGISVSRHKALCFMHDDHNPSLAFFGKNREWWKCFACDKSGNAINLVQEYYGCTFVEACKWLEQHFGNGMMDYVYTPKKALIRKKKETIQEGTTFLSSIAEKIIEDSQLTQTGRRFLFDERKYDRKVVQSLNIISIDKADKLIAQLLKRFGQEELVKSGIFTLSNSKLYLRFFTPCLVYPYYDEQMAIIGIQSRYLGSERNVPRFQFISGQKTKLYNMQILASMQQGEDLYICEGVTDCMALLSSGKKAVAIPSATNLPKMDLMKLVKFRLHMYPDNDPAGEGAFCRLRKFFIDHYAWSFIKEPLPIGVKDYSEYYLQLRNEL